MIIIDIRRTIIIIIPEEYSSVIIIIIYNATLLIFVFLGASQTFPSQRDRYTFKFTIW